MFVGGILPGANEERDAPDPAWKNEHAPRRKSITKLFTGNNALTGTTPSPTANIWKATKFVQPADAAGTDKIPPLVRTAGS